MLTIVVEAQKKNKADIKDQTPLFNGLTFQADVASLAGSLLSNGETYSYEAGTQFDLKHKLFPVIELGLSGANKTASNNINFKTNGLYGRLGVDINLLNPGKDEKPTTNLFLAGIRFGMSRFPYSISNASLSDEYWGGSQSVNFIDINTTKIWYEIVVGLRVEVTNNLFMGWTVRNRTQLSQDVTGEVTPWYIPGYGNNSENSWGISYVIGYKFHHRNETKTASLKH